MRASGNDVNWRKVAASSNARLMFIVHFTYEGNDNTIRAFDTKSDFYELTEAI